MDESGRTRMIKFGIIDEYDLTRGSSCYHSMLKIGQFEQIAASSKHFNLFNGGRFVKSYNVSSCCAKYIKSHHIIINIIPNPSRIQIYHINNLYQPVYASEPIDQVGICHIIFSEKHQIFFTLGIGIKSWQLEKDYSRDKNQKITTGFSVKFLKHFALGYMAPMLSNPCFIESKDQLVLPTKDGIVAFDVDGNMLKCPISYNSKTFTLFQYNESTKKSLTSDCDQGVCLWNKYGRLKFHYTSVNKPIYIAFRMTDEFYIIYDSSTFISIFDIKTDRVFPIIKAEAPPLHIFFERERGHATLLFIMYRNRAKAYRVVIPWSLWRKVSTHPLKIERCPKANGAARIAVLLADASIQLFSPVSRRLLSICHARITGFPVSVLVDRGMHNIATSRDQLFVTFDTGMIAVFGTNGQLMEPVLTVDLKATCCVLSMFCGKWCLLIGTEKGDIIVYEYKKLRFWKRIGKKRDKIFQILHHDETHSFFVFYEDCVVRYNTDTGEDVDVIDFSHGIISCMCGSNIVIGYEDGSFNIARVHEKIIVRIHSREKPLHKGRVTGITPGRSFFVTSGYDGTILVWSNECEILVNISLPLPILSVAFLNGKRGLLIGTPYEIMIVNGSSLFGIQVDPEDPIFDNFDKLKEKMNGRFQLFDDFDNCEEEDMNFLLDPNYNAPEPVPLEEESDSDWEYEIDPAKRWVPAFQKAQPSNAKNNKNKGKKNNNQKEKEKENKTEDEEKKIMGRSMRELMDLREMEMLMEEADRQKELKEKQEKEKEEVKNNQKKVEEEEDQYEYVEEEEEKLEKLKQLKAKRQKAKKVKIATENENINKIEEASSDKKSELKSPKSPKSPKFVVDEKSPKPGKSSSLSTKSMRNNSSSSEIENENTSNSSMKSPSKISSPSSKLSTPISKMSSLSSKMSMKSESNPNESPTKQMSMSPKTINSLSASQKSLSPRTSEKIEVKQPASPRFKQNTNKSIPNPRLRQKNKNVQRESIIANNENNQSDFSSSTVKLELPSARFGKSMGSKEIVESDVPVDKETNEFIEIDTKVRSKKHKKSPKSDYKPNPILHTKDIGMRGSNKTKSDIVILDDSRKSSKTIKDFLDSSDGSYSPHGSRSSIRKDPKTKMSSVKDNIEEQKENNQKANSYKYEEEKYVLAHKNKGISSQSSKNSILGHDIRVKEPSHQYEVPREFAPVKALNPRKVKLIKQGHPDPDIDIRDEIPAKLYFDKNFLKNFVDIEDESIQQLLGRLACFHGAQFDIDDEDNILIDEKILIDDENQYQKYRNVIESLREYLRQTTHRPKVFRVPHQNEDEMYYCYDRSTDVVNHHPRRITVQERSAKLYSLQHQMKENEAIYREINSNESKPPFVDFGFRKQNLNDLSHIFDYGQRNRKSCHSARSKKIEKPIRHNNSRRSSVTTKTKRINPAYLLD